MSTQNGWSLLFHPCLIAQISRVAAAADQARARDGAAAAQNANVKLFAALAKVIYEVVPENPGADQFRQGNTLGPDYRHWRRVKFGGRFRLYFRYDTASAVIVYAWVNDERTLRQSGGRSDPYAVFSKMLQSGNPPDNWATLVAASEDIIWR